MSIVISIRLYDPSALWRKLLVVQDTPLSGEGLMQASSNNNGIGQPVRRREDFRLLTGKGCYSDDYNFPGQAYAVMVRSPHAHALIRAIETSAAAAAPGVLAVLTGRDLLADGLQAIPH